MTDRKWTEAELQQIKGLGLPIKKTQRELELEQQVNELLTQKPRLVMCHPCKGASPADDYVGIHMSNEDCPACRNAEIGNLKQQVNTLTSCLEVVKIHLTTGRPDYALMDVVEALQSIKESPREGKADE